MSLRLRLTTPESDDETLPLIQELFDLYSSQHITWSSRRILANISYEMIDLRHQIVYDPAIPNRTLSLRREELDSEEWGVETDCGSEEYSAADGCESEDYSDDDDCGSEYSSDDDDCKSEDYSDDDGP